MKNKNIIFGVVILIGALIGIQAFAIFKSVSEDNYEYESYSSNPYFVNPGKNDLYPYTNKQFGFSIKLPNLVSCCHGVAVAPVVAHMDVDENSTSTTVVIGPQFNDDGDFKIRSLYFEEDFKGETYYPGTWVLSFGTARSENEALDFLRTHYGKSCEIESVKKASQKGVFDISLVSEGIESDCPLNFVYQAKYFPEENRIVTWGMGQDQTFALGMKIFDQAMADSFRFIKK